MALRYRLATSVITDLISHRHGTAVKIATAEEDTACSSIIVAIRSHSASSSQAQDNWLENSPNGIT